MIIKVKRIAKKEQYTIGKLYIDDKYICDTIEDKDRGITQKTPLEQIQKVKIPSKTAIPTGKYKVSLNFVSPTFVKKSYYKTFCNGYLPRLLSVPGFDGILMHRGKSADNSSGCIILGYNKVIGKVTDDQKAFETVYSILKKATDQIYIIIE